MAFRQVGVAMMRLGLFAVMAFAASVALASAGTARAEVAAPPLQRTAAQAPTELSAQRRVRIRRRATPVYIYGRRPLSPTAVRSCVDWYAYEYRPSGTVIVPKMSCHWIDR